MLEAFAGHKVVVRTLDAGSDKPLKFAGHPEEANPALGVRGIRIAEGNPGLLERQLEAIAAAAERTGNPPWVMAPMIATADEAKHFAAQARSHGLTPGVMIEVPAAALLADRILEHVDFLSIGTNDLAQYTMAADRMSAELATLTDPWQPAVLALVATAVRAGAAAGKPVGVCGEAAADPLLACVLTGLGVTSLSAAAAAIPGVGAKLAQVTLQQCRDAADAVLATASAADARAAALAVAELRAQGIIGPQSGYSWHACNHCRHLDPPAGDRARRVGHRTPRPVDHHRAARLRGRGFPVVRAFAGVSAADLDPFVHMDQMGEVEYQPGEPRGTDWHPHRGFETVTYMIDGRFAHQDSHGGGGLITDGATQWMTAGSGILHIETPPAELVESGGVFHGIQLWVNLPRKDKFATPKYQAIEGNQVKLLSSRGRRIAGAHHRRRDRPATIRCRRPSGSEDPAPPTRRSRWRTRQSSPGRG